ncbi:MAG: hypothetical protein ACFCUR_03065 [Rhodomicrobiaceae bacterium]
MDLPSYRLANAKPFWEDRNRDFGVWHAPDREYRHLKSCFNVTYRTNAHGMRDASTEFKSEAPRVVVLGDSFVEGFGVSEKDRLTERLEQITKIPHLNFGTSGSFGLTQSWLLYKTLASKFEHDAVIISILPDNDFTDDDFQKGKEIHHDRYRPYLVGEYPDYELRYYNDDPDALNVQLKNHLEFVEKLFNEFSYTVRAYEYFEMYFRMKFADRNEPEKRERRQADKPHSRYFDYTQAEFDRMKYAIEQIAALAKPRPVMIMSIPRQSDYIRARSEAGAAPLTEQLRKLSQSVGATYVDLLEKTGGSTDFSRYFYSCDPHWSPAGHDMAADQLDDWAFYSRAPKETTRAVSPNQLWR